MTLPLLVSLVGLTSCLLVISINTLTFTRTNRELILKRIDLVLIYTRCALDVFVGIAVLIYITMIIVKTLDINKVTVSTTYFVVFASVPTVFLWPTRFLLSIGITIWRILCLTVPLIADKVNFCAVSVAISVSSVLVGLSDVFVLLVGCPLEFTVHVGCMSMVCMTGSCFTTYLTFSHVALFSLTFICLVVYSFAICFCETKECREKRIVETDYWFVLCMFITTVFDCIPFGILFFGGVEFGYNKFGPFINTLNIVGALFDALVVSKIFETHQFF